MVCATPSGRRVRKVGLLPLNWAVRSALVLKCSTSRTVIPNRLEPRKRPRTTLVNYIVSQDGVPIMTVGCPGGDHQAQANMQLVLNSVLWGMNPQEAVEAPRFASQGVTNSFYPHTYYPGSARRGAGHSSEHQGRADRHGPRHRHRSQRRNGRDGVHTRPADRCSRLIGATPAGPATPSRGSTFGRAWGQRRVWYDTRKQESRW